MHGRRPDAAGMADFPGAGVLPDVGRVPTGDVGDAEQPVQGRSNGDAGIVGIVLVDIDSVGPAGRIIAAGHFVGAFNVIGGVGEVLAGVAPLGTRADINGDVLRARSRVVVVAAMLELIDQIAFVWAIYRTSA